MKVLVWHVHGSWATAFVTGSHDYLLPTVPGRGPDGRGRARTWDWPATAVEVSPAELGEQADDVDVVVLQRPEEVELVRRWTGLRVGVDVPAVYVEHNAPTGTPASTRHPMADLDVVDDGRLPIVHVTAFNALMWDTGRARTVVVDHGVPDPGYRYTGARARVGAVVNEPVRRWRVAGTDVLLRVARDVPVAVYGMGVLGLADHDHGLALYDDLPQARMHDRLAEERVYLHPYRWTSLGLSLLEAMALGLPVLALPTTEAPAAVPPGAGVLSARPDELARAAQRLLAEPERARELGRTGRAHVLDRYSLERFQNSWDALLQEVTA